MTPSPTDRVELSITRTDSAETCAYDIIVCGAGPAGLATAAALAPTGLSIALCGKLPIHTLQSPDTRTAALFTPAIEFLDQIGAWTLLEPHCAPIKAIRIVDAGERLWRAPETLFSARDISQDTLAYNCPNTKIVAALVDRIRTLPNVSALFHHQILAANCGPETATITVKRADAAATETLEARLNVAADGRRSVVRTAAGIDIRSWTTGQHALTAQFAHSRPHGAISTEFHRRAGPLTVVPLPGDRSALVWVDTQDAVAKLLAHDDRAFAKLLKTHLNGLLGDIELLTPRRSFELTTQIARRLAHTRVILVGEAAHAFPPIGAQGLNLTLRDVAALRDAVESALQTGTAAPHDVGNKAMCTSYEKKRAMDVSTRVYGVDVLGRSLTSAFVPAALARGAVLHAANAVPLFKRLLIEQGTGITGSDQAAPTSRQPRQADKTCSRSRNSPSDSGSSPPRP